MTGTGSVSTGTAISTTGLTYLNWATGFVPSDASKWREVNLVATAAANVRFKITLLRKGGSNFYLDAVRVSSSAKLGINDELASSINFNLAPNPFNTATELTFELTKTSEVNISVIDILGRNMGTLLKGNTNAGNGGKPGSNGKPNTGGGGGGGQAGNGVTGSFGSAYDGGSGGSGIVVVYFLLS